MKTWKKTDRHKLLARGMSAKTAANRIRVHVRTNQRRTLWMEVATILDRRTTFDHSSIATQFWFMHVNLKNANLFSPPFALFFDQHFCKLDWWIVQSSVSFFADVTCALQEKNLTLSYWIKAFSFKCSLKSYAPKKIKSFLQQKLFIFLSKFRLY